MVEVGIMGAHPIYTDHARPHDPRPNVRLHYRIFSCHIVIIDTIYFLVRGSTQIEELYNTFYIGIKVETVK